MYGLFYFEIALQEMLALTVLVGLFPTKVERNCELILLLNHDG